MALGFHVSMKCFTLTRPLFVPRSNPLKRPHRIATPPADVTACDKLDCSTQHSSKRSALPVLYRSCKACAVERSVSEISRIHESSLHVVKPMVALSNTDVDRLTEAPMAEHRGLSVCTGSTEQTPWSLPLSLTSPS